MTPDYLPPAVRDEVRRPVHQTLQAAAVPTRAEFAAWLAVIDASRPPLTPQDRAALSLVLPALASLRPRVWVTTGEVLALAAAEPGPEAAALRQALDRFASNTDPAKAVGRFLRRCAGRPVNGLYLQRVEDTAGRRPPLYQVAGF
jgi:hypothetical protein